MRVALVCLYLFAGLAPVGPARAERDRVDVEHWYVVRIQGAAVGFASESVEYGSETIVMRAHTSLSLSRMGTPITMFMLTEETDGADGGFLRATMEMDASLGGMEMTAVLDGDSLRIESSAGGQARRTVLVWEEGAVSQWQSEGLVDEWVRGAEPELRVRTFSVDDGEFETARFVRGETRAEIVDGREVALQSILEYEGDGDAPLAVTWLSDEFETVRTVISQMGMEIVVEAIDASRVEEIELEPEFDIIRQSMIPVEGYPDKPGRVQDVTLRIELSHPVSGKSHFEGPNQHETQRGADWVDLLISRATVNTLTMSDDERSRFLEPGTYIQSDHPSIVALADSIRRASGAEGWELARAMAAWVSFWINEKNFGQGFASALDVLSSRQGDCTEHAILLAALLRAAGLPARAAVGLAYFDGTLVGHMWTEVYVDHWRTLDALDLEGNPVRVRIAASSGARAVDQRDLVAAYAIAGGATVRVVAWHPR